MEEKKLSLYEKVLLISMIMGSGLSFNKVYLYHIFFVINFLYWGIIKKFKIKKNLLKENIIIIIFFIYSSMHMFFIEDYILAIKNQIYILLGVSIFFTIKILLNKNKNEVLNIFKKIFILACFIGVLETINLFRWYVSPYDLNISYPAAFYWNTNDFATILIGIFPFVFFMKNFYKKIIFFSIVFYLLKKCDSRSNEIALIIEIFIFLLLILQKSNPFNKILIIFIGIFTTFLLKKQILSKFLVLYDLIFVSISSSDSLGVRKALILNLLSELKKTYVFLFGTGGGNSIVVHKIKNNTHGMLSNHSFFLELFVEYGVFIFSLLGIYYLKLIYRNFKFYLKTNNYINGSLFISLIGFSIGLNSMSGVIYFFPFWILLGIADFYSHSIRNA